MVRREEIFEDEEDLLGDPQMQHKFKADAA
jgi:hypothetical protein